MEYFINFIISLASGVVLIIFNYLRIRRSSLTSVTTIRLHLDSFIPLIIIWFVINAGLSAYVVVTDSSLFLLISTFFISSTVILFLLWKEIHTFRAVGIRGVDKQILRGINYKKSLQLCQNELKFLGIGAGKLVREDKEFKDALNRCKHKPIKFLLCHPENQDIISAAKSATKPPDEYKRIVINSLRTLARIKNDQDFPIEVHLYSGTPIFRLMFVNDSICFFSYHALGEGDGSTLPQLFVLNPSQNQRAVNSFYYSLNLYFDDLWHHSETWDFKKYLD